MKDRFLRGSPTLIPAERGNLICASASSAR